MLYRNGFVSGLLILLALNAGALKGAPAEGDSTEVVYKFQLKLASRGQASAQYKLGMLYETGRGIPMNVDFARQWYERAAAQDYRPAIDRLIYLDIAKQGVQDTHTGWLDELRQRAKEGDGEAQFLLGQMYATGIALDQNLETAIVLLRKAAGNNIPGAEEELLRVEKLISQRQAEAAEQKRLAEEKQLAEQKARAEQQAKRRALEEQKKREARQKQLVLEKERQRQLAEQQLRKKQEAEKAAQSLTPSAVTPDPTPTDANDICSGRNRFLPTCR